MISQQLASWQTRNHYRSDSDVVYGVYRNCGFSASEDDGGLLFVFMLTPRDDDAFDDLEEALSEEGGEIAVGQVGDVEGYLAIFFDQQDGGVSPRTMDSLLDFVADQARSCGFRVPNTCVKCGARATKRSFVDGMVQPLCAECSAQNRQSHRSAPEPARPAPEPTRSAPAPIRDTLRDDARYAEQYAPIIADDSKYDDSYDEYAGMSSPRSRYDAAPSFAPIDTTDASSIPQRNYNTVSSEEPAPSYDTSPISFSDDGQEDEYHEIMGEEEDSGYSPTLSETVIGGSLGMGILGAVLGAVLGVIPYIVIALLVRFPMGALCFPAGMLAVIFYTLLKGRRSVPTGMVVTAVFSALIALVTMFVCMTVFYMDSGRGFSQAMQYLISENAGFLLLNSILAVLGAVFGALVMVVRMSKYAEEN